MENAVILGMRFAAAPGMDTVGWRGSDQLHEMERQARLDITGWVFGAQYREINSIVRA